MSSFPGCMCCGESLTRLRSREVVSISEDGSIKSGPCDKYGQLLLFGGKREYVSTCWYHRKCWESSGCPTEFFEHSEERCVKKVAASGRC